MITYGDTVGGHYDDSRWQAVVVDIVDVDPNINNEKKEAKEVSETSTSTMHSNPRMIASSSGTVNLRKGWWATKMRKRLRAS